MIIKKALCEPNAPSFRAKRGISFQSNATFIPRSLASLGMTMLGWRATVSALAFAAIARSDLSSRGISSRDWPGFSEPISSGPNFVPRQIANLVPDLREHPPDLTIAALAHRDVQRRCADGSA